MTRDRSKQTFDYGPEVFLNLYQPAQDFPGLFSVPKIGTEINYLPEYDLELGVPVAPKSQIGLYLWQRPFQNGVVVVNADPTNTYSFQPSIPSWTGLGYVKKDSIGGAGVQFITMGIVANRGTITYTNVYPNDWVGLGPGEAAIIMY